MTRAQCIVFLLLMIGVSAHAQQKDFVGLTGIKVEKRLSRSFDLGIAHQSWFNQNLNERWISFEDASMGYRINRYLLTELHYRYIRFRNLDNGFDTRQLFYHTISYSDSYKGFSFSIRNRIQQLVYGDHFNDGFKDTKWYDRLRFTLRYRADYYWSPYLSYETFVPISNPTRKYADQWRSAIGLTRTMSDQLKVDVYFQIQQQANRQTHNTNYVAALNVYYLLWK